MNNLEALWMAQKIERDLAEQRRELLAGCGRGNQRSTRKAAWWRRVLGRYLAATQRGAPRDLPQTVQRAAMRPTPPGGERL